MGGSEPLLLFCVTAASDAPLVLLATYHSETKNELNDDRINLYIEPTARQPETTVFIPVLT